MCFVHIRKQISKIIAINIIRKMSAQKLTTLKHDKIANFLQSFDTVLTDCDGVLWILNDVIPNAPEALNGLRHMGKRIFYVTNNSTKTREGYVDKCRSMGFIASKNEVLSASYLTACYLQDKEFKKKAYIIGTTGISKELDIIGISHSDVGPDPLDCDMHTLITSKVKLDPDVGVVIVGFDEHLSFPKMVKAASYLNNPDCLFLATNTDERFPLKSNLVTPGSGCMVAAVECSAMRKPVVIGKPSPYIKDFLIKRHKIDPSRTLMIGDRGNTDILLGYRCGFNTLMVLTGVSSLQDITDWQKSNEEDIKGCIPNYYVDSLGDIVPLLKLLN